MLRLVERRELGNMSEGEASVPLFSTNDPAAGMYLYRVQFVDPATGSVRGSLHIRPDGESVRPQPGNFYGGWITADVVGPFKGEPGTNGW
mgnify:CR=1 FL=1